jgi:hypothetical protein
MAIADRIRQAEDALQEITRYESEQRALLSTSAPAPANFANQLQDSLERFEKTVQGLSTSLLARIASSGGELERIETEIEHIGGSLEGIRANAGRHLTVPPLPAMPVKALDDRCLPRTIQLSVAFPSQLFTLNLAAYQGIGSRVEDPPDERPLIVKLPPGAEPPRLWSRTNDFFVSMMQPQGDATSFSEAYGPK